MMATLFSIRLCEHQSASHFNAAGISVSRFRGPYAHSHASGSLLPHVHSHTSGSLLPGEVGYVERLYSVNKSNDAGDHAPRSGSVTKGNDR